MNMCDKSETKKVDFSFGTDNYYYFGLYEDNILVSMGNYSVDLDTKIAHIGILTPLKYTKKGYGLNLVNTMILDILEKGLIPQYRFIEDNISSKKISEKLGFTPIIKTVSLFVG